MTATPVRPLLLPGQAAAPEGPCDLTGMYVIHHGFRRDLSRFARAAHATPEADIPTWVALLQRWDRFAHLLHDHHAKEDDVLWPLLLQRADAAGDDAARSVLDAMEAEHALIDPLLAEARALLASATEGGPDRGRLLDVLGRSTAVLDGHLGHEESEAVAVIQRHVDGAEWNRIENDRLRGKPSLGEVLYFLPWLTEGLPPDVVGSLMTQAGPAFRTLHRLGRRRFRRLERRAFGNAMD
jgi:hypothetical protein